MIRSPQSDEGGDPTAVEINIIPLIDIMFFLVVFFLLTANTAENIFDLKLPSKGAEHAEPLVAKDKIVLTLFSDRETDQGWAIDGDKISAWPDVAARLENAVKANDKAAVVVVGDRTVSMEKFLQALTFLQSHGVKDANIMMDKNNEDASSDPRDQ